MDKKTTSFDFIIQHKTTAEQSWPGAARAGVIHTPHGSINTPSFIFCATNGVIRGVAPDQMKEAGTQVILSNTYHLMLQPGPEIVAKLGGLHKMVAWNGPMLTDSGGFQIFSLGGGSASAEIKGNRKTKRKPLLIRIEEEGAVFKSYIDGSIHTLTPESSVQVQRKLGADLILVLDECSPYEVGRDYTAESMSMSHRWALRSIKEFEKEKVGSAGKQALYGIVQGGVYEDLRLESAEFTASQDYFGYAIGGCLGSNKFDLKDVMGMAMAPLNAATKKPHPTHLLGIGGVVDIWDGVAMGIDTFDCVNPTRLARHGGAYVRPKSLNNSLDRDHINRKNSSFRDDNSPIDLDCNCYTCRKFTRAYLHHLIKAGEITVSQYIAIHNVSFMNRLMDFIRTSIMNDDYASSREIWFSS